MKRFFVLATLVLVPLNVAHADISSDLEGITKEANQNFSMCDLHFSLAHAASGTPGAPKAQTNRAYDAAVKCRENELARIDQAILPLKKALSTKPKAMDALKEFYTYWRAAIQNVGKIKTDAFVRGLAVRAEAVRTEATW